MAIHSAGWIRILIAFLPDILDLLKGIFKYVPKEEVAKIAVKARVVAKKIEGISTGDQKETWKEINQVADAIFPDEIDIENP